jgi:hypothetical protein
VDPGLLTDGKLRLVQETLDALLAGRILTIRHHEQKVTGHCPSLFSIGACLSGGGEEKVFIHALQFAVGDLPFLPYQPRHRFDQQRHRADGGGNFIHACKMIICQVDFSVPLGARSRSVPLVVARSPLQSASLSLSPSQGQGQRQCRRQAGAKFAACCPAFVQRLRGNSFCSKSVSHTLTISASCEAIKTICSSLMFMVDLHAIIGLILSSALLLVDNEDKNGLVLRYCFLKISLTSLQVA